MDPTPIPELLQVEAVSTGFWFEWVLLHSAILILLAFAYYCGGLLVLRTWAWTFPGPDYLTEKYSHDGWAKSTWIVLWSPIYAAYLFWHFTFTQSRLRPEW